MEEKNPEILDLIKELLSPDSLESIEELDSIIKPLPGYVGPGEWLKLLK